jgi:hypothetical protein
MLGVALRAGNPISFWEFTRKGVFVMAISVTLCDLLVAAVVRAEVSVHAAAEVGSAATRAESLAWQRLTRMHDFYAFRLNEIPALAERWQQQSPG